MKNFIKFCLQKIYNLVPIQNLIVLESQPDFTDNSKVIYDYLIENKYNEEYEIIWVVNNASEFKHIKVNNVKFVTLSGSNIFQKLLNTMRLFYINSRASHMLYGNKSISFFIPKDNQKIIYLTHGVGLKSVGNRLSNSDYFNYITATSHMSGEWLKLLFKNIESKLVYLGNPRLDLYFDNNDETITLFKEFYNINLDSKLILWVPTYRRHSSGNTNDANKEEWESDLPILNSTEEWEKINNELLKNNSYLIIKPHPAQDLTKIHLHEVSNIKIISDSFFTERDLYFYRFMFRVDAMISDYSSIYLDYLISNKPVAFSIDDLEEYSKEVGFLAPPLEYMPGKLIYNIDDFISFINDFESCYYEKNRMDLKEKYFGDTAGKSTAKVIEFLEL